MFDYQKILTDCITYLGDFVDYFDLDYLMWELRDRYPSLKTIDDLESEEFISLVEFCAK